MSLSYGSKSTKKGGKKKAAATAVSVKKSVKVKTTSAKKKASAPAPTPGPKNFIDKVGWRCKLDPGLKAPPGFKL